MPLTLVKEDGNGLTNSNSYGSSADGDAYHDAHLYPGPWTAASTGTKEKALVMATRLIDSEFAFNGYKTRQNQALQWPRDFCLDPDTNDWSYLLSAGGLPINWRGFPYFPYNIVPKGVIDATCEMARRLMIEDRTANAQGGAGGVQSVDLAGALSVSFFAGGDPLPTIPREVNDMLSKYGYPVQRSGGIVKLTR